MPTVMLELLLLAAALSPEGEQHASPAHNPGPPLTVELSAPASVAATGELALQLEIERTNPDEVPLAVAIRLPPGVILIDGEAKRTIVDPTSPRILHTYRLRIAKAPEGDVVVTVVAAGRTWGAHAAAHHRFGREAPPVVSIAPGPELRGPGGLVLARPVALPRETVRVAPRLATGAMSASGAQPALAPVRNR